MYLYFVIFMLPENSKMGQSGKVGPQVNIKVL